VRLALFTNSDYLVSVDNLARTSVRAGIAASPWTRRSPSASRSARSADPDGRGHRQVGRADQRVESWRSRLPNDPPAWPPETADQENGRRSRVRRTAAVAVNVADGQRKPRSRRPREPSRPPSCALKANARPSYSSEGRASHNVGVRGDQAAGPDPRWSPSAVGHAVEVAESPNTKLIIPRELGTSGRRQPSRASWRASRYAVVPVEGRYGSVKPPATRVTHRVVPNAFRTTIIDPSECSQANPSRPSRTHPGS